MLKSPEYLTVVVEFAIGLAGFSAIVSVFLHSSRELRKVDRHRLSNLLSLSLVPAFAALACMGFELLLGNLDIATRLSSALLALALVAIVGFAFVDRRSIPSDQLTLIRQGLGAPFFVGISVINVLAQVGAVIGLIHPLSTFFFGLIATLLLAAIQFVRIILIRSNHDDA
jgi:hypothetical protein